MHQQKLIQLLASLTKEELEKCKKYLVSTMRTTSFEYKLFDYLYKYRDNWQAKRLGLAYAIASVRPDSSTKQFENIMSALTSRIEQYLMLYDAPTVQKRFENQLRLAQFYKRKSMNKYLRQSIKKLTNLLDKIPVFDTNLPWYQLQLQHLTYFSNLAEAPKDLLEDNLLISADLFERQQQVYQLERQNLKNINNRNVPEKEATRTKQVMKLVQQERELLFEQKETAYWYLKKLLFQQHYDFSQEHAYRLYTYLVNYAIGRIKQGNQLFINECGELHDFGVQSEVAYWNGKLSERAFLFQIDVKSKVSTPSFTEVTKLIDNCHQHVQSENFDNLRAIAYATYYLATRNFDKGWECIKYNTFSRQNGPLFSKGNTFLLIFQYKSKVQHIDFQGVIDKTRKKFSKKIPDYSEDNRQACLNLISCVEKFWKRENPLTIKQFVENCRLLTQRKWIEEELTLLTKKG